MQVDVNELKFIQDHTPNGMYSIVAERLIKKGFDTTRFSVAKEAKSIKDEYSPEIINEVREVFKLLTGLTFEKTA